jgi:DNA-binding XRE family transcriptional regulator
VSVAVPTTDGSTASPPDIATEIRRRRDLLRWSQAELAVRSGVSRTTINEVESGKRTPEVRTYEKLRAALGLTLTTDVALIGRRVAPENWTERRLATLAGCLLSGRGATLAVLADALGVSIRGTAKISLKPAVGSVSPGQLGCL